MRQTAMTNRKGAFRYVRTGLATRQAVIAYIFLLPALIYFTVFFFVPIAIEFYTSLQKNQEPGVLVGFQNYIQAFGDSRVLNSVGVTVVFAVSVTLFGIILGLLLAVLLDQPLKGIAFLRAVFLVPYLTSAVIVGLMWRNILDPLVGVLNRVLSAANLPTQDWLSNYQAALPAVIAITIWQGVGYNMLLFLAGLQGIPPIYQEAAKIDGAGPWSRFWYITVPLLANTTLFVSIISVISTLQAFTQAYVITQGGPADATRFYVFNVFDVAFNQNNFAYASALTFLMFIAILVLTFVQLRVSRKGVEY
ncbi:MAG TPA: sugar ABC transporter permease [Chloroflexia bacterium]|nr:sugar ABC transporter permease [Chloroflexia bacterium]